MKYVVIDTETTGLDPKTHEMLSIGAIVMIDNVITETIQIKIRADISKADPEALRVNGYSDRRWKYAVSSFRAFCQIRDFFYKHQDGILVGHNVQFDIKFVRALSYRWQSDDNGMILIPYPYMDTMDLARSALVPYGLKSVSLDNICEFLGWERRDAHSALSDCEDCIKLLRALCPASIRFTMGLRAKLKIRQLRGWIK
jgi:DNA polymerase III epsilon subunit-like protein